VVDSWNKKSKCYVYFSRIPQDISVSEVFPPERNEEIAGVGNEQLRLEKYWSWKTLEYALFRSFGYRLCDLKFSKSKNGKWTCDKCFFSIACAGGYVAVAVSNMEIGVAAEEVGAFEEKCLDGRFFDSEKKRIVGKKEPCPQTPFELLMLRTQKESVFKRNAKKNLRPVKIQVTEDVSTVRFVHENASLLCSISGSDTKKSFFYYYNGEEASKIKDIIWI
jgi:phosphopantetheinyl transferase